MQVYLFDCNVVYDKRGTPVPEGYESPVHHDVEWAQAEYEAILQLREMLSELR